MCEYARPGEVMFRFSMTAISKRSEARTDSVPGPANGNQSLHFIFFRRKTIRGMEQFQLTVAISTLSLHATKVVRLELLEIVKRDLPAASRTAELRTLDFPEGILSLTDGRSLWCAVLTRVAFGKVGGGVIEPWSWVCGNSLKWDIWVEPPLGHR